MPDDASPPDPNRPERTGPGVAAAMPIGMFSRASLLSIPALRSYHESGLLVPAVVDPRTGYRSYTPDQLADAAVIARLRALDLPLAQVREIIERRDPAVTAKVLAEHRAEMEERLAETERIVAELSAAPSAVTHTPIHVRREPAVHTLRVVGTITLDDATSFFEGAYARLYEVAAATGAVPVGPPGALYDSVVADDPEPVEAYVPIREPVALPERVGAIVGRASIGRVSVGEVPAVEAAVVVHPGPFEECAAAYRTLGAWVARHAEHADERVREIYLVGPTETSDATEYRTEIVWPIVPGSAR